jgi:hypothetical protein
MAGGFPNPFSYLDPRNFLILGQQTAQNVANTTAQVNNAAQAVNNVLNPPANTTGPQVATGVFGRAGQAPLPRVNTGVQVPGGYQAKTAPPVQTSPATPPVTAPAAPVAATPPLPAITPTPKKDSAEKKDDSKKDTKTGRKVTVASGSDKGMPPPDGYSSWGDYAEKTQAKTKREHQSSVNEDAIENFYRLSDARGNYLEQLVKINATIREVAMDPYNQDHSIIGILRQEQARIVGELGKLNSFFQGTLPGGQQQQAAPQAPVTFSQQPYKPAAAPVPVAPRAAKPAPLMPQVQNMLQNNQTTANPVTPVTPPSNKIPTLPSPYYNLMPSQINSIMPEGSPVNALPNMGATPANTFMG